MRCSWFLLPALGLMLAGPALAEDAGSSDKPSQEKKETARFSIEVMVVHATRKKEKGEEPEIDSRIGDLPELRKDPFRSYDKFELLDKVRLPLIKGEPQSVRLPNRRVLRTTLLQVLPKDQVRFSASIDRPGGKDFLPLLEVKAHPGKAFIVAGQSHNNGILVLVLRVV